jgi:hypothetical protein
MRKRICTLLILCCTLGISGQNVTLLKNFNPKVRALKHDLNSSRDSLVLEYEKTIVKVDIFNEDFEKLVVVESQNAQISLEDIPEGKFVIEVTLSDKIVLMDVIKHEANDNLCGSSISNITEGQGMMLDESLNIIKNSPHNSIEYILTGVKRERAITKKEKFYWVVIQTNTEIGSSKTMKLVDQKSVDRMILKNKLENRNTASKFNKLIAWEVYDTSKFMEQQLLNSNFMHSQTSDVFNTTPYYATKEGLQNL